MRLDVYLLPDWTSARELAGRAVVVIDILRATTTMTRALSVGAREVIPCLQVDDALGMVADISKSRVPNASVLGGERSGQRIDGFHFGNSPAEYTIDSVGEKTLVFTTTNGTRAMQLCRGARRVLLGTFNNLSALIAELEGEADLALLCAGTDGRVTAEDVLFAGAFLDGLLALHPPPESQNDESLLARSAWIGIGDGKSPENVLQHLRASRGGRNLVELGMDEDIAFAAQIDTIKTIAELDVRRWRIHRLGEDH